MDKLYSEQESGTISEVQLGIIAVDITQQQELLTKFCEILSVFAQIRSKITTHVKKGLLTELEIEFDHTLRSPELRLILREQRSPRTGFGRAWQRVFKPKTNTQMMVFSRTGSRSATPDNLDKKRYRNERSGLLREHPYSPSSFKRLQTFIRKFHKLVHEATKDQAPPS